jgi:hypothetical protein
MGEREKTTYTIIPQDDGRHGVKVSTSGRFPPEYHVFPSREHAETRIDGHRRGSENAN